ncbi:MAG: adenylate/guanylate cyclase domain-containing protein [Spirochaetota bacterium]
MSIKVPRSIGEQRGPERWVPKRPLKALLLLSLVFLALSGCSTMRESSAPALYGAVEYDPAWGFLVPRGPWERYQGLLDDETILGKQPSYILASTRSPLFPVADDRTEDRTYRLRVTMSGTVVERSWILVLPLAQPPARVLIDGVARMAENNTISFNSDKKEVSIVVQVPAGASGLDSRRLSPGILFFAEASSAMRFLVLAGGISFLFVGIFALAGLFLLLLFNLWTKNKEFLAFAILLVAEAIRYLVNATSILPFGRFIPLDLDLLQVLAFNLQFAALVWFFAILLKERSKLPGWLILLPILAVSAAEILWIPGVFLLHSITLAYYAAFCFGVFASLLWYGIKGSSRALWLVAAPLCLLAAVPLRVLLWDSPNVTFFAEPLLTVLFAIIVTNGLLRKIGKSFLTSETLTDYVSDVSATVKRFIPQEFLDALEKRDIVDLKLGDHVKKDMTIFFSDIRAFTELSEQLTVEENFAFINSYLSRVVPIIKQNGGFIDKYIGDAIMALYPGPDGPDQALRTAIEMQGKINEYNGHRAKVGYRPISMGVGLHMGSLMLGVVGVDDRMENTVISDSVNLASRLQAITKAFNIALAISEQVFKSIKDPGAYTFRFIGKVKVKGKVEPVSVFEIFDGIEPSLFERKVKANTFFEQGMLAYYQKDFSGAMYYFKRVLDSLPEDGAASFYLETCMNRASL